MSDNGTDGTHEYDWLEDEDSENASCALEGIQEDLPALPTSPELEAAIHDYVSAEECRRIAINAHDVWYFDKSAKKMVAIMQLMTRPNATTGKLHSATSAEAVVETNEEYHAYLMRGATLAMIQMHMETAAKVAEMRMQYFARQSGRRI